MGCRKAFHGSALTCGNVGLIGAEGFNPRLTSRKHSLSRCIAVMRQTGVTIAFSVRERVVKHDHSLRQSARECSREPFAGEIMIVAFLQNAWSPVYAGTTWPRDSWLNALHRSRSGQRLAVLLEAAGKPIWFDNTTPIVGAEPSSIVAPDLRHIQWVLWDRGEKRVQRASTVVCFGKQAAKSVRPLAEEAGVPVLIVPHPAYRCLTNDLYTKAGTMLATGFTGVVELLQKRGAVHQVDLCSV